VQPPWARAAFDGLLQKRSDLQISIGVQFAAAAAMDLPSASDPELGDQRGVLLRRVMRSTRALSRRL
jgi:hypothetical protein